MLVLPTCENVISSKMLPGSWNGSRIRSCWQLTGSWIVMLWFYSTKDVWHAAVLLSMSIVPGNLVIFLINFPFSLTGISIQCTYNSLCYYTARAESSEINLHFWDVRLKKKKWNYATSTQWVHAYFKPSAAPLII